MSSSHGIVILKLEGDAKPIFIISDVSAAACIWDLDQ
jgi:hypothetical protein